MNLIKHIANLLALWTIPFVIVLFFVLLSGFSFTYHDAVNSGPFIIVYALYSIMVGIMYLLFTGEDEHQSIQIFKTK